MTQAGLFHRPCPACGADAPRDEVHSTPRAEELTVDALRPYWSGLFKEKVFFSYARCGDCGLLFAPTYFTPERLDELYADMAPNMDVVPTDALAATQAGYWEAARRDGIPDGGYLEIGPDVGFVVRHAAEDGRFDRFWLVEPNRSVHEKLAAATLGRPHRITTAMDDLSMVPDGSVALAVMVHVFDHVLEPVAALERILAKLKPGGLLAIVTHDERSLLRHAMGTRWPPFCLQHPEIYNPRSMDRIVRRAGFASVAVKRSTNHFPLPFLARQAAYAAGVTLRTVPLPDVSIGLKLGNMMTLARR